MQWNTFIGEYIFFKSYSLKSYSCRFICVWDDSIYNPDPVSSVDISQSCCQSQVSGTGAGILCPVPHHQIHARYDHLYWRDTYYSWSLHPSLPGLSNQLCKTDYEVDSRCWKPFCLCLRFRGPIYQIDIKQALDNKESLTELFFK